MKIVLKVGALLTTASLAGCGGSGTSPDIPPPDPLLFGAAEKSSGGRYTTVTGARDFSPQGPTTQQQNFTVWGTGSQEGSVAYSSDAVVAMAGHLDGENYAGISGNTAPAPPTGKASFVGSYVLYRPDFGRNNGSKVTFTYNADTSLITAKDDFIVVEATVDSNGSVTGKFIHNDEFPDTRLEADLLGGLYDSDNANQDFVAVFNSDSLVGAINASR